MPFLAQLAEAWPPDRWRDLHVLVAVSGGPDSVALLRGLVQLKADAGGAGKIFAAHVNHQLRGAESDADEAWTADLCRGLNVELFIRKADTTVVAHEQGDGVEAAARSIRYQLLTEIAQAVGARYVALGHTRDDQAETVLFRLFRGSGLRGLAGMPASRPLSGSATIMRPLLTIHRADCTHYLAELTQDFRRDSSNDDPQFARNRIRRELLPQLRDAFGAHVDDALADLAEQAAAAHAAIEAAAADLLEKSDYVILNNGAAREVQLNASPLAEAPFDLACETIRLAWRQAASPEQDMTRTWWRRLTTLAREAPAGASLNLPANIHAAKSADKLTLRIEPSVTDRG